MRQLIRSRLIWIFSVCKCMSEFTWCLKLPDFTQHVFLIDSTMMILRLSLSTYQPVCVMNVYLFVWFNSLRPSQHFFSYVGTGLFGLNQFYAGINVSCPRHNAVLPVRLLLINIYVSANMYIRPLVNSAYQKINFLISQPKHMLWVLFWTPKTYVKTDG